MMEIDGRWMTAFPGLDLQSPIVYACSKDE